MDITRRSRKLQQNTIHLRIKRTQQPRSSSQRTRGTDYYF
jgi:hypothetical protein